MHANPLFAALAPSNRDIHRELIDVLTLARDERALERVRETWQNYNAPIVPDDAEAPAFYVYDGYQVKKLLSLHNGNLVPYHDDYSKNNGPVNRKANRFYLYTSRQELLDVVQTTIQHDCFRLSVYCPPYNPVRGLELSREELRAGVIATKVKIDPPRPPVETALTPEERQIFVDALLRSAASEPDAELRALYAEKIEAGDFSIDVGRLSPGGLRFVISQVTVNSMNDAHYSFLPFGTIYLLAEERDDGGYSFSKSKDLQGIEGCGSSKPFDFDRDGTDEVVLYCEALEGTYSYATLVRNAAGEWALLR